MQDKNLRIRLSHMFEDGTVYKGEYTLTDKDKWWTMTDPTESVINRVYETLEFGAMEAQAALGDIRRSKLGKGRMEVICGKNNARRAILPSGEGLCILAELKCAMANGISHNQTLKYLLKLGATLPELMKQPEDKRVDKIIPLRQKAIGSNLAIA